MKILRKSAILILLLGLGARLALPVLIKASLNRALRRLPGLEGRVEEVDLSILQGKVGIRGVTIRKVPNPSAEPLAQARRVGISFRWPALFRGMFVGRVAVERPAFSYIPSPAPAAPRKPLKEKAEEGVRKAMRLPPFKIQELTVQDGRFLFQDPRAPGGGVEVKGIQIQLRNLTNIPQGPGQGVASLEMKGRLPTDGRLDLRIQADQFASQPKFEVQAEILKLDLVPLNPFLLAYARGDVSRGEFNLAIELSAEDGSFQGYVKPTFDHLDLIRWDKDKKDPIRLFKKALVAAPAEALKNLPKDRLGARIPVKGTFGDPQVGVWKAAVSLLRNAFLRALYPGLEGGPLGI